MYQSSNLKPEASNLLETIIADWENHLDKLKESFPLKEPNFYSFAYWLVRYSGLVQPASPPNQAIHSDGEGDAVLEGDVYHIEHVDTESVVLTRRR